MYKRLLASTALVAAGLVGASAAVQAQTAPAAQPLQVTVGGYFEQSFGYADNDDGVTTSYRAGTVISGGNATTSNVTLAEPNKWGQQYDSEIWFNVKGTLANGISVGARVELEGNTESDTIDESYLIVEGAFGRLDVGSTGAAANKMHVSVPAIGKAMKADSAAFTSPWIVPPAAVSRIDDNQTHPELTGDDQLVSYYSPRFAGLQLGVSFVPNQKQDLKEFTDERAGRTNVTSAALNFTRAFGAVNVEASAGWEHAGSVDGAAAGTANADDIDHWALGLRVGFAGFSVGGGYKKADEGNASTTDGDAWSAGVAYTFGPATVGVQYIESDVEGTVATAGNDKWEHWLIGANYTLGPGVDLFGNIFGMKYKDEASTAAADNNKGTAALVGMRLTF